MDHIKKKLDNWLFNVSGILAIIVHILDALGGL